MYRTRSACLLGLLTLNASRVAACRLAVLPACIIGDVARHGGSKRSRHTAESNQEPSARDLRTEREEIRQAEKPKISPDVAILVSKANGMATNGEYIGDNLQ